MLTIDFYSYVCKCRRLEMQAHANLAVSNFKFGELCPENLHHVKTCDHQKTDMSCHDLLAELKECKL